jgi:hypothetical protein
MQSTDWLITRKEGNTVYFKVHQNIRLRWKIWLNYFLVALIFTTVGIIFIGSEGAGKIIGYLLAFYGIFYALGTIATGLRFLRKGKIKDVVKFSVSPSSINLILKNKDSYPAQIDRSDIVKLFIHQPEDNQVVQQQYEYSPTLIVGEGVAPALAAATMHASKGAGLLLGGIVGTAIEKVYDIQNKVNKSSYYLGVHAGGMKIQLASSLLKDQAIFLFHKVEEALSGRAGAENSNTNNRYSITSAQLKAAGDGRVKTIILFTILSLVVAFKAYIYIGEVIKTQKFNEVVSREHVPWSVVAQQVKDKSGDFVLHGEVTGRNVFLKNNRGENDMNFIEALPVGTPVEVHGCKYEAHEKIQDDPFNIHPLIDVTVSAKISGTNRTDNVCGYLYKGDFAILPENNSPTN